jgi:hypothetical protein
VDAQKPGAENKDETKMEGEGAPTDATNGDTKSEDKKDQVSPLRFIHCCGSGMLVQDLDFYPSRIIQQQEKRRGTQFSRNIFFTGRVRFYSVPYQSVAGFFPTVRVASHSTGYIHYGKRPFLKLHLV